MSTSVPTLSSLGWVSTIEEKGDFALSYFFTSEYSQSVMYHGRVASLQWLVQNYGSDPNDLQSNVRDVLESVMRGYFGTDVSVGVVVSEPNPEKPGQLTIQFQCTIQDGGREYSLGRSVEFMNAKLISIAKLNNG